MEIRTRALHCLLQKVELGLVSVAELSHSHVSLVPHLLKLVHLGPPSVTPHLLTLLLLLAEVSVCVLPSLNLYVFVLPSSVLCRAHG